MTSNHFKPGDIVTSKFTGIQYTYIRQLTERLSEVEDSEGNLINIDTSALKLQ